MAGIRSFGLEPSDVLYFSKGPVSLRPQLEIDETYNDNVFYTNQRRRSDFVTMVSPGLNLQVGEESYNHIKLGYNFERLEYIDHSELDANQHRIALKDHFEKGRFLLDGRDQIQFLSSTLGGGISVQGLKIDRTTYFDEYRLDYRLGEKTAVYLQGSHFTTDYDERSPLYDSRTLTGTGGFEFKALAHTSFFGEVYYGQTHNPVNASLPPAPYATFIGGFLGARGNFTEKLSGMVKAGYESREFSDHSPGGSLPVVEMSLTERFTENMALSLIYSRRQQVSVQFARSAYTSDSFTLNWQQAIGNDGRFHINAYGTYAQFQYDPNIAYSRAGAGTTASRFDTLLSGGVQMVYDFKIWLRGKLSYDYERLRSDLALAALDYDLNRVTVGLSIGY